jgi:hypothetical protein
MTYHRHSTGQGGRVVAGAVDKRCRVDTYEAGRVCAVEGCDTKLSLYNPSPACACHAASWASRPDKPKERASRPEPTLRSCAHERCGREFLTTNAARKYCSDACRMRAWSSRRERGIGETARAS